jgi:hypothetical protein
LNRSLNKFSGECECERGFKSLNGDLMCEECFNYKGACVKECPKNTILDKETSNCNERNV